MSKNSSSPNKSPDAATRNVVMTVFNVLQPHAQRAKVFSRGGVTTISLEMPRDVKITRRHFAQVAASARGGHCWVEWAETGLRLCIKLSPPRGTKRKSTDSQAGEVQPNLKKQCGEKAC